MDQIKDKKNQIKDDFYFKSEMFNHILRQNKYGFQVVKIKKNFFPGDPQKQCYLCKVSDSQGKCSDKVIKIESGENGLDNWLLQGLMYLCTQKDVLNMDILLVQQNDVVVMVISNYLGLAATQSDFFSLKNKSSKRSIIVFLVIYLAYVSDCKISPQKEQSNFVLVGNKKVGEKFKQLPVIIDGILSIPQEELLDIGTLINLNDPNDLFKEMIKRYSQFVEDDVSFPSVPKKNPWRATCVQSMENFGKINKQNFDKVYKNFNQIFDNWMKGKNEIEPYIDRITKVVGEKNRAYIIERFVSFDKRIQELKLVMDCLKKKQEQQKKLEIEDEKQEEKPKDNEKFPPRSSVLQEPLPKSPFKIKLEQCSKLNQSPSSTKDQKVVTDAKNTNSPEGFSKE